MRLLFQFVVCFLISVPVFCQEMSLEPFASGFNLPVDITHAGDDRLFITEKAGTISILRANGTKETVPFLDIRTRVNAAANERGLLGLCFHPDYKTNGYFYVHYTNSSGHSTISRFSVTQNPDIADPASEKIIIVVNQPFNNHNAGDLEFGPDGYLYIGMGDGGSGGDPGNRSQNPKNLLGKMLRLDVNTDLPYLIPEDNPWANNVDTLPEIWAFGLRNPWRFSFDRQTGDLWIGDVGQNKWEEINFVPKGTPAVNYGWRCYEGPDPFNTQDCKDISFYTPPVFSYRNPSVGCSVTGGYVYRGTMASRYQGQYILADYCSGRFWSVKQADSIFTGTEIGRFTANQYVTFGEDRLGNLYVGAIQSGRIFRFVDPKCLYMEANDFLTTTPVSCHNVCDGSFSFDENNAVLTYFWSGQGQNILPDSLCPGTYQVTVTDTIGCFKTLEFSIDSVAALEIEIFIADNFFEVFANQPATYQWYKDGAPVEGAVDSTFSASGAGAYYVIVTNEKGCTVQSMTIVVDVSGINDKTESDVICRQYAYGGEVFLSFSKDLETEINLFDIDGKLLSAGVFDFEKSVARKVFSTDRYPAYYILTYEINGQKHSKKIFVR